MGMQSNWLVFIGLVHLTQKMTINLKDFLGKVFHLSFANLDDPYVITICLAMIGGMLINHDK